MFSCIPKWLKKKFIVNEFGHMFFVCIEIIRFLKILYSVNGADC